MFGLLPNQPKMGSFAIVVLSCHILIVLLNALQTQAMLDQLSDLQNRVLIYFDTYVVAMVLYFMVLIHFVCISGTGTNAS